MDIDTKLKNDGAVSYSHKEPIYILFNPWCKRKCPDDQVIAGSLCTYKSRCSNDGVHKEPGYNVAISHAEVKYLCDYFLPRKSGVIMTTFHADNQVLMWSI
jgi:hypothetical protein